MCGIVGFNNVDNKKLTSMVESINHRGPDDVGTVSVGNFSLGHVRLSIIDLSIKGHQPMIYKQYTIVYNGEVYNYKEIKESLLDLGYIFDSDTDSEVILKSFDKWGVQAVDKFIGMFAFAIYDSFQDNIYIFRDRTGIKPLYYYHSGNEFAFASEIKALKQYKDSLIINQSALQEYFKFGYISSNNSIYNNINQLQPGHYMVYENHQVKIVQYWSIDKFLLMDKFEKTENELLDELEALLINAFKYRMVSDVPVGVFLSGGIDSSVVAAILQKHYGNIQTFTIGFENDKYDESVYAEEIAKYIGTKHITKIIRTEDAKDYLSRLSDIYDEPFGDASAIPTLLVCKLAKDNGIKVVLSADGGDEVFCGYDRFWKTYKLGKAIFKTPYFIRYLIYNFMRVFSSVFLSTFVEVTNFEKKYSTIKNMLKAKNWNDLYVDMVSHYDNNDLAKLFNNKIIDNFKSLQQYFDITKGIHPMQGMMLWDYHRYLSNNILVKVDRATMHYSIEGRVPLLDHRIAEFMARVPFEYKYRGGESKYLLKKILERYVPKELFERPKMGFTIPKDQWLSDDLKKSMSFYLYDKMENDDLINSISVKNEYKKLDNNKKYVNYSKLWLLYIYKLWFTKNNKENKTL